MGQTGCNYNPYDIYADENYCVWSKNSEQSNMVMHLKCCADNYYRGDRLFFVNSDGQWNDEAEGAADP